MKKSLFFALFAVAVIVLVSVMGCGVTSSTVATAFTSLRLLSSSGTELVNNSTTTSRVISITGSLESSTVQTVEVSVNSVSNSVPVVNSMFTQEASLIAGANTIAVSAANIAGETSVSQWTINADIPTYGIWVQLVWDTYSDMDLHFNKSTGTIVDSTDCYYSRKAPNWDGSGSNTPGADLIPYPANPVLDTDNVTAYGPENTVLVEPENGTSYWVKIRAFSGTATPTVRVYINGALSGTYTVSRAITSSGVGGKEIWTVCTINWAGNTGTVVESGTIATSSIGTSSVKPESK